MAYVDPKTVVSPKSNWCLSRILMDTGQGGWSAAEGLWDGLQVLGLRWNGASSEDGVGNPQSRGHPTWFIVPGELESVMRAELERQAYRPITCNVTRPPGYDVGAWRFEAMLSPQLLQGGANPRLAFDIPELGHRHVIPEKSYRTAVNGQMRGLIQDGRWLADVYSNGIDEANNPTKIEQMQDAVIAAITDAARVAGLIK